MCTNRVLASLFIATLISPVAASAADRTITVIAQQGRTVAEFKVGDSNCTLENDRLSCTPVGK
jgi:hypothetical protein